jgi:hypothetical protein
MRTARYLAAAAALLTLAAPACKAKDNVPQPLAMVRPHIIKDIPALPGAIVTDTAGSEDAERRSYLSQLPFDSVRNYYRTMLPAQGWAIIGDRGDSVELDLYTRKDAQTVWVHIKRVGSRATEYTVIANGGQSIPGVPVDTTRH